MCSEDKVTFVETVHHSLIDDPTLSTEGTQGILSNTYHPLQSDIGFLTFWVCVEFLTRRGKTFQRGFVRNDSGLEHKVNRIFSFLWEPSVI